MDTSKRLQKTAITKMLNRAQLAEFHTHQFNNDVVITFLRSDRAAFERVLDVQGFGYDICVPFFTASRSDMWGGGKNAGRRVRHICLGADDTTIMYTSLIVSFAQNTTEVSA
jgi:hypothetical protein